MKRGFTSLEVVGFNGIRRGPLTGFTLVELLVVIVIIAILASLLLPALASALCRGRSAAATHLIEQLTQSTKMYEFDNAAYPPEAPGYDSKALVGPLSSFGPRNLPYFHFEPSTLDASGRIVNHVFPSTETLRYRLNAPNWPGNLGDATAHNKSSFDLWGKDCAGRLDGLNNWGD